MVHPHSHAAQARVFVHLSSSLSLQTSPAPTSTLAADAEAEFHKLQQLWPIPQLPTSFLPQKTAAAGEGGAEKRKGCNNKPKPFHLGSPHIYRQAQFSAALPLSLAHNQMIT